MAEQHPPTTTTIPSDPAAPAPSEPPKPPRPSRPTSLQRLRALILRYITFLLRKTDRNIVRVSKLFSSPTTTDYLLCTTSYTLAFVHALLSRLLERRLESFASSIAEKATPSLLPGETLIATLPTPPSTRLLAQTTVSVKALAAVVGDYRIFVRLWGMLGIYTWARGTWGTPLGEGATRKEKVLRSVTWASIASCVGFQALENGAYLAGKGVLVSEGWTGEAGKNREAQWWVWSSRFWAGYVVLELVRLGVLHYYKEPMEASEKATLADGEKEGKLLKEEKKREDGVWWRDLASNLAYMPMTVHWSLEEDRGILNDWGVGVLGAIAGGANLVHAWKDTA
ncbi:hypothetical protein P280DRAFT_198346 [Massarina eburnea CBS 473.64]|uniref:Peroxin 11C n=1 Tax=Massarina eburnea CBS 473.64 TaxID=1395130 RepID=A0A6A6RJJ9_9PLEO|nr:hypothetical protein P280DRAFT_198346 [Massarina eburnea CBS 473.64]